MSPITAFQQELEREALTTRKMLSIIPTEKFGWKPHEKSMTIKVLATHIADIFTWFGMVINTSELDFAKNPYQTEDVNSTPELVALFEKNLLQGRAALANGKDEQLTDIWVMRNGEAIWVNDNKHDVFRMCFAQIIHHRAQLGVFLRLLNIPIPGSYGPSADEMGL
ncbi:MAG: DinB family protein [Ferruginibacter sp.]